MRRDTLEHYKSTGTYTYVWAIFQGVFSRVLPDDIPPIGKSYFTTQVIHRVTLREGNSGSQFRFEIW